jgi:hypothetical protein
MLVLEQLLREISIMLPNSRDEAKQNTALRSEFEQSGFIRLKP